MRSRTFSVFSSSLLWAALVFAIVSPVAANPAPQKKEYLTDSESDRIREAVEPASASSYTSPSPKTV